MNYNNLNDNNISLKNKIKLFEIKLLSYIDIYNITYTTIYKTNDSGRNSDDESNESSESHESHESNLNQSLQSMNYSIIQYYNIKLEKIGNIEVIYRNFNNINKHLAKQLLYSIHQLNFTDLFFTLQSILNKKGHYLYFINYTYELFKVIGISSDNMYVIQQKEKSKKGENDLELNFEESCRMFIIIRDKLFTYTY
jgi:hypothetical protein